jgi:predicted regulator of Ras-like GTPase activity (Roadblock/LC7/MglB family)
MSDGTPVRREAPGGFDAVAHAAVTSGAGGAGRRSQHRIDVGGW